MSRKKSRVVEVFSSYRASVTSYDCTFCEYEKIVETKHIKNKAHLAKKCYFLTSKLLNVRSFFESLIAYILSFISDIDNDHRAENFVNKLFKLKIL